MAVQKFEVPVERDLDGNDLYHAKKRFEARGWKLNFVWYRRSDQLTALAYCEGVTDPSAVAEALLG